MIARVLNPKWTYIPLLLSFLSLILIVAALSNGFSYDIISRIDYVDGQIVRAINGAHTSFWDSFMYQFTQKWLWVPFYVTIVAFLSLNFTLKQMFFIIVSIVLVILLADQICAGLLRPMFARFRPSHSALADTLHFVNGYRAAEETRRTEDYDLVMRLAAEGMIGKNLQECLYYVYEPADAYQKHTLRTRWYEIRVRIYGLRKMKAPARDYIYLVKPMILCMIPRRWMKTIKRWQWKVRTQNMRLI